MKAVFRFRANPSNGDVVVFFVKGALLRNKSSVPQTTNHVPVDTVNVHDSWPVGFVQNK